MKKVVVIGGGIVGLCSAYYLSKEGHQVTVIDASDMSDGCSFGNAGMIVPSHVIPLAQPGMITQGMKWMFNKKSPFYVRPRFSASLLAWGRAFQQHATQAHMEQAMPALRDLSLFSKELYQDLAKQSNFQYTEKGLLMLFRSERVGDEETEAGRAAQRMGLEVDFLNKAEVANLETGLSTSAIGAVHYRSDAHIYPQQFIAFLVAECRRMGVDILSNSSIESLDLREGRLHSVRANGRDIQLDDCVLSAGSWSAEIAKRMGVKLSILPGKGYSFETKTGERQPTIPSILCEGKVAVTPFNTSIRFGGTLEITHTKDHRIRAHRVQGIVDTIHDFYPEMKLEQPDLSSVWHGFRPCTPTGMPYISRSKSVRNLIVATGHSMMGISMGPGTGKLVEELVSDKQTSISIDRFAAFLTP